MNVYRSKLGKESSEYQKKIESINNVILCVAEAERMFRQIGTSLISKAEILQTLEKHKATRGNSSRSKCRRYYL